MSKDLDTKGGFNPIGFCMFFKICLITAFVGLHDFLK
jgi:hypothetical protein